MKKFYCYNRCSTCAKARKWLNEHQVEYEEIDIVKTPPSADFLFKLIEKKQHPIKYFFNTSGLKYRQLNLKDKVNQLTTKEASQLLASDGKLIKRPLMVESGIFTCGFKPDVYQEKWNN
ncbi:arsenate reductase family protein [Liquorilactobacillus sicerae]|uniref:arsenate reductase family protein n=1 Tax=Liquorilactobacillus sicerae TaxID=1416943 RepID=UPI0024817B34|nr:arsenate reductase family protein [Liquorilactobacillus sicerae]